MSFDKCKSLTNTVRISWGQVVNKWSNCCMARLYQDFIKTL
ncbi:hypothetical protein [Moraxella lacunata]